ncbi:hypothetical protein [Lentzea waywayandensis]|uniref:hypothetical protein n=1 Tax=Lentzea waywayandensis TaxID=84724 RepID=UPI000B85F719|nr:hypothetical protein [Lentzea waywayandensis]
MEVAAVFLTVLGILLSLTSILVTVAIYRLQKRAERDRKEKKREAELKAARKRIAELEARDEPGRSSWAGRGRSTWTGRGRRP